MSQLKVELRKIRKVKIGSRVADKDGTAQIVTTVSFEYTGDPTAMRDVLLLESQNHQVDADFTATQSMQEMVDEE